MDQLKRTLASVQAAGGAVQVLVNNAAKARFDGDSGGGLLLIATSQRDPIAVRLEHLVQIVQATQPIVRLGAFNLSPAVTRQSAGRLAAWTSR